MQSRSKIVSFFAGAFGVAVLSTAAFAQDTTPVPTTDKGDKAFKHGKMKGEFGRHHGKRGGFRGGFGLRGIDLTDAQKAQIKSIREANKPDQATMTELKAMRDARKAGQEITTEQKARMQAFREQARTKAKSVNEQILAVLTPEQKTQLETRRTEMRERFKNRGLKRQKRQATPTVEKPVTN
jgi:protein CpxP